MLQNFKQHKQEGFTIIEVLIVLAIAGLIMLVVFLAVPQLQRNSRNTQRRSDVSNILGAASEFTSNNNGKTTFTNANLTDNVKLGYYEVGKVTVVALKDIGSAPTADEVKIVTGAKCTDNATDAPVAGSTRQYAAYFAVESKGSSTVQCQGV